MPTYSYVYNGETYSVALEALADGTYRAVIGDRSYTLRAIPNENGGLTLAFDDGDRATVYASAAGSTRYTAVNGDPVTFALPEAVKRSKRSAHAGDLTAQMPGQVRDVLVSAAQDVKKGQTLLLLEAMKMEIRIAAPIDGTIKSVRVKVGDVVEMGQLLIEIE